MGETDEDPPAQRIGGELAGGKPGRGLENKGTSGSSEWILT
jgi:hypothetical protein